jgi:hypothetical protein
MTVSPSPESEPLHPKSECAAPGGRVSFAVRLP